MRPPRSVISAALPGLAFAGVELGLRDRAVVELVLELRERRHLVDLLRRWGRRGRRTRRRRCDRIVRRHVMVASVEQRHTRALPRGLNSAAGTDAKVSL